MAKKEKKPVKAHVSNEVLLQKEQRDAPKNSETLTSSVSTSQAKIERTEFKEPTMVEKGKKERHIAHVSSAKKKTVKELVELIKTNKTILIASIKNLPTSQYQEIGKKLRGKAIVKVPRKNLILRSIDDSKNEDLKQLKEKIGDSVAILFSNQDSFDLAIELIKKKSPAKAKPGQEAPEDIEVPAGPTDLVPGPAISELGALGIMIQIDKGKIAIKEPKVIVKKGQKISQQAADVMAKLDIKPFLIGFVPIASFDTKENKYYSDININPEETIKQLKELYGKVLPFAVAIQYVTPDTIKYILLKAETNAKALSKFENTSEILNKSSEGEKNE